MVEFDFLGKDSIRYQNSVPVDAQAFKNLRIFMKEPKQPSDMLFDRVDVRAVPPARIFPTARSRAS